MRDLKQAIEYHIYTLLQKRGNMKIKVIEDITIETDEYSERDLYNLHAYYYQQGLKDIAQKLINEYDRRKIKDMINEDQ